MEPHDLTAHLEQFVSSNKQQKINAVLQNRTNHLTLVLENIYQPQNASATLRTAECLGIQNIHVIEKTNTYRPNKDISLGSSKWVDIHRYPDSSDCFAELRSQGYRLIVTSPHETGQLPETLEIEPKSALIFGTEMDGVSKMALEQADAVLRLPIYGFAESYNLSVSVAMTFYTLIQRLRHSCVNWQLSPQQKQQLRLDWYRKIVKNSQIIEQEFLAAKG